MFNTISKKKLAVYGFAFKKDTGDTRETPAIDVCRGLMADGANVSRSAGTALGLCPVGLTSWGFCSVLHLPLHLMRPPCPRSPAIAAALPHPHPFCSCSSTTPRWRRTRSTTTWPPPSLSGTTPSSCTRPSGKRGACTWPPPGYIHAGYGPGTQRWPCASLPCQAPLQLRPAPLRPGCCSKDAIAIATDPYAAAQDAHGICVLTEWDEFKGLDYQKIYDGMVKVGGWSRLVALAVPCCTSAGCLDCEVQQAR